MRSIVVSVLLVAALASTALAVTPNENLAPLAPFVGKTWRGEFADSTPEAPNIDVQRWEWALGGQAIRIVHSLNDGEYGGETMVIHDRERDRILYFYFTTAGFYTTGTIAVDDGMYVAHEEVTGSENGIAAVRSTAVVQPDGSLHGTSEYLRDGEWIPGHEIVYVEDPSARVVLPQVDDGTR